MANRIKELNPGGPLQLTDTFGVDRASPDETFKITGQSILDKITENIASSDKSLQTDRILVNLLAVADIDGRAIENSGKFYDLFDNTNDFSEGVIDTGLSLLTAQAASGQANATVTDGAQFSEGQEITLQNTTTIERKTIDSIATNTLTFTENLTNTFEFGDSVYRSIYRIDENNKLNFPFLPQNISEASFSGKSISVRNESTFPTDLFLSPDGTKMYVSGDSGDIINQYTLSTAWDISTATFDSVSFSVSGQETTITGVTFKPDGLKMYICGTSSDSIHQYSLSSAWDISTASYDSKSLSVNAKETAVQAVRFFPDGLTVVVIGYGSRRLNEYTLSTAWDVSTGSFFRRSPYTIAQDEYPAAFEFNHNGTKAYIAGYGNNAIYQYSLSTPYNTNTLSYDSDSLDISAREMTVLGLYLAPGTEFNFYIVGSENDRVYQYNFGKSAFTEIDIRYNITPNSDKTQIAAWIQRDKLAGFSLSGETSIVDSTVNESFQAMTKSTIELDIDHEEDQFIYSAVTAEDKITLKITLTRLATTDDTKLNKILGAID